jgi:hypothetical protein
MVNRLYRICGEWKIPFKAYDRQWLENTDFYKRNQEILDIPKGNGLWAWKPYIIMNALNYDDDVIYLDSSVLPINKESFAKIMKETCFVSSSETSYPHKLWTKRSCFVGMDCDEITYWSLNQVWAGVVTARYNGMGIISDWLELCTIRDVISDDPCENNFIGFMEHRHDQSILTNLLKKYDQPLFDGGSFRDVVDYEAK